MDNVDKLGVPVLLLYFDHISDLSVLHDSVTLVKIICMVIGRSGNANLLVYIAAEH